MSGDDDTAHLSTVRLGKPVSHADTVQLAAESVDTSSAVIRLLEGESIAPFVSAGSVTRYHRGELLGSGGMGEVRSQEDRATGRSVAMKTMHPDSDAIALRRFSREARIQSQLEHPSIVPVYDIGQSGGGVPFITMKLVRGESLAKIITQLRAGDEETERRFTLRKLLTILSTVALTIEYVHQRGVIHRDLKPENIMLGPFGEVYVLDWGLAAIIEEHEKVSAATASTDIRRALAAQSPVVDTPGRFQTAAGLLLGTPGYIAPELLEPNAEATPRSDVYALGTILFEILTQERLHKGDAIGQVLGSAMTLEEASPRERCPAREIPPELDALCRGATRKDPARRIESAGTIARRLEAFLDGDRDVVRRRELAASIASKAATLTTRNEALREVTTALGLDPDNAEAKALLVRLLTEPPPDADQLADRIGHADALAAFQVAARTHILVQLSYLFYVPLLLWMGIRDWTLFLATGSAITLVLLVTIYYLRNPPRDLQLPLPHLAVSLLAIGTGETLFGPLILVPGIAVATGVAYLASFDRRAPWVVAGIAAIVLVPAALQLAGVLAPSYELVNGRLVVLPMMTELPPIPTAVLLLVTHAIVIVAAMFFTVKLRRAYTASSRALRLQAWQLSQLVPEPARRDMQS